MVDLHCSQYSFFCIKICHLGTEPEGSSHFLNLASHGLDNIHKYVCAKMRLLLIKDFRISPCFCEALQNFPVSSGGIFYQSVQLSV